MSTCHYDSDFFLRFSGSFWKYFGEIWLYDTYKTPCRFFNLSYGLKLLHWWWYHLKIIICCWCSHTKFTWLCSTGALWRSPVRWPCPSPRASSRCSPTTPHQLCSPSNWRTQAGWSRSCPTSSCYTGEVSSQKSSNTETLVWIAARYTDNLSEQRIS